MVRLLSFVSMSFGQKSAIVGRVTDVGDMHDKAEHARPVHDLITRAIGAYVEYVEADWRDAYPGIMP